MLNRNRIWILILTVGAALLLTTVYLAIFIAPPPQTSVATAGEIMPAFENGEIIVAGFVSEVYSNNEVMEVVVADFIDYTVWLDLYKTGNVTMWQPSTSPIDVAIASTDGLPAINVGDNISVRGRVVDSIIGTYSQSSGLSLHVDSAGDVEKGFTSAQFEITTAPVAQKIFYFHMPAAWASYVAFFITFVGSILYLRKRDFKHDQIAQSAVEIGLVFASIAIVTGMIWGNQEWGVPWRWEDTKLFATFILWLVYIGYISLRTAITDPYTRARLSGVYGILSFITVPMSFLSSRLSTIFQSSHPTVIATKGGGLSPEAGMTVGIAVVAFTLLFFAILLKRMEIVKMNSELEDLKSDIGGEN